MENSDSDSTNAEIEDETSDLSASEVTEELNLKDNLGCIKKQIKNGTFLCDSKNNPTSSSTVWNNFNVIKDVVKKINLNFVECVHCKKILSYNSKSGTSHLLRHNCQKILTENENPSPKITNFFQKKSSCDNKTISAIKKDLTVTLVQYCAGDLRPFESVSGSGFELLANKFIEIGTKYGTIEAKKIIPDPTTISRNLLDQRDKLLDSLRPIIITSLEAGQCAATTDMWTDDYKKRSYSAFTVHYIDNKWNLIKRVPFTTELLCTKRFDQQICSNWFPIEMV